MPLLGPKSEPFDARSTKLWLPCPCEDWVGECVYKTWHWKFISGYPKVCASKELRMSSTDILPSNFRRHWKHISPNWRRQKNLFSLNLRWFRIFDSERILQRVEENETRRNFSKSLQSPNRELFQFCHRDDRGNCSLQSEQISIALQRQRNQAKRRTFRKMHRRIPRKTFRRSRSEIRGANRSRDPTSTSSSSSSTTPGKSSSGRHAVLGDKRFQPALVTTPTVSSTSLFPDF